MIPWMAHELCLISTQWQVTVSFQTVKLFNITLFNPRNFFSSWCAVESKYDRGFRSCPASDFPFNWILSRRVDCHYMTQHVTATLTYYYCTNWAKQQDISSFCWRLQVHQCQRLDNCTCAHLKLTWNINKVTQVNWVHGAMSSTNLVKPRCLDAFPEVCQRSKQQNNAKQPLL